MAAAAPGAPAPARIELATKSCTRGSRHNSTNSASAVIGLGLEREQPARSAVDQHHLTAAAGDHHGFGHVAQDRLEFVALLLEPIDLVDHRVGGIEHAAFGLAHRVALVGNQMRRHLARLERLGNRRQALGADLPRAADHKRERNAEDCAREDRGESEPRCDGAGRREHGEQQRLRKHSGYDRGYDAGTSAN